MTTIEQNSSEEQDTTVRSDWFCEVVRIGKIEKHPNADTLSITNVLGGYPCIFKTGDFKEGDLASYISVDSLVPVANPEFAFLDGKKGRTHERIKARKLRGIFSMGLLVKAPPPTECFAENDSIVNFFGILKYEPPSQREHKGTPHQVYKQRRSETAAFEKWTTLAFFMLTILETLVPGDHVLALAFFGCWNTIMTYMVIRWNRKRHKRPNIPYYDIPSMRRYGDLLMDYEDVVLTEKIHGSQAAYVWSNGRLHMKSRTVFRGGKSDKGNPWGFNFDDVWEGVARKYDLAAKLKNKPDMVLFGEIHGDKIQKAPYNYGYSEGNYAFAAFDVMDLKTRKFLDWEQFVSFCRELKIPQVPVLYVGAWSKDLSKLCSGKSKIDPSVDREGWVCKPTLERHDMRLGRMILKMVSEEYLIIQGKQQEENIEEVIQEPPPA